MAKRKNPHRTCACGKKIPDKEFDLHSYTIKPQCKACHEEVARLFFIKEKETTRNHNKNRRSNKTGKDK